MNLNQPFNSDLSDELLKSLSTTPESTRCKQGEQQALSLFHEMAERVPAYKDFLAKHDVNPKQINSIDDFKTVPLIDKDNYLRKYPREMLVWDGEFDSQSWVISSTSGSTGKPYYFPRQSLQDDQYALVADLYLRTNFQIHEKSTLYIVAFPMGAWIGGLFTYEALKKIADTRGYPLSIITPGIHKLEILNAVRELGSDFDQVLIGSYAPFLKDFLDDGEEQGIDWHELDLGFIFSAEVFSETFRDYVQRKTGIKNIHTDTLNHYGTVDLGTMAHETPVSICLRRYALQDKNVFADMFAQTTHLPTFAQYLPELFYFETVDDDNLVCSANSGIPLVRYDLKDRGGVLHQEQIEEILENHGGNFKDIVEQHNLTDTVWNLPYVYVYERRDFSVSFYAFQIYPQTIRKALQQDSLIDRVTGKFTMRTRYDDEGQHILEIDVELAHNENDTDEFNKLITDIVTEHLIEENSEYREVHRHYGAKIQPQITLWPYEHTKYFQPGTKQKWVEKDNS